MEKKARNVVMMDLRKVTSTTDFFVICTADSDTQVKAIADSIVEGTMSKGVRVWHSEGMQALFWVVLDYVDVVVHIFLKEARSFYNLERLWSDAGITEIEDEAEQEAVSTRRQNVRAPSAAHRKTKRTTKRS